MESRSSEYRMRHSGEGDKEEQIGDKGDTEKKIITRRKNLQSWEGEREIAFFTLPVE
jgi:hypothetical protein